MSQTNAILVGSSCIGIGLLLIAAGVLPFQYLYRFFIKKTVKKIWWKPITAIFLATTLFVAGTLSLAIGLGLTAAALISLFRT